MPYLNDMEGDDPLAGWDYNPENWRIVTEGGNRQLQGRSGLANPIEVLGNEVPEWTHNDGDLVISYRLNLLTTNSVARTLFSFSDQGYYALEILSGFASVRRGSAGQHLQRDQERIILNRRAPIQSQQWYEIMIWVEGARINVYVDNQLLLAVDDSFAGELPPGSILFQTLTDRQGINLDDLKIEQPLLASEHFEGADFPSTWTRSNSFNVTMATDGPNQFVYMRDDSEVRPDIPPLGDMQMAAKIMSIQGGLTIRLHESDAGALELDMDGGNLTVRALGPDRSILRENSVRNFYGRGTWFDLVIRTAGDRLFVYRDGQLFHEESYPEAPHTGTITFLSEGLDIYRLDDVLFTEIARSISEDARFAFDILAELQSRPIRELLNDWYEFFDDPFRTDWWWEGGQPGPGQYINDPASPENSTYYRLTYLGRPTWRLLREALSPDRTIFGQGGDHVSFNDSSDFYARVLVRFPDNRPGTAWLGARAMPTITGANLDQYRFALTRHDNGDYTIAVQFSGPNEERMLFEGEAPRDDSGMWPEWFELVVIALDDRIAFFCNGRLIAVDIDTQWLGGTVAIGVEEGTTADFDDLVIRDTSPRPF